MKIVFEELCKLIKPISLLSILLMFLFLFVFDDIFSIFLSIFIGSAYSLFNFFLIGSSIAVAIEKKQRHAQLYMFVNYLIRYIITGMIIYYSIKSSYLYSICVVLPMFFPKVILICRSLDIFERLKKKEG